MSALPRTAWLAIGAIAAAILGGPIAGLISWAGILAAAVVGLASTVALLALGRPRPAAFLLGLCSVGLHVGLADTLAGAAGDLLPLPVGRAEWRATVVDLSSPSGAEQRGMVRLEDPDGGAGWLVYAWLPRHPAVIPGDTVALSGEVRAPPEDAAGFADFLRSRGAAGTIESRSMQLQARGSGLLPGIEQARWSIDGALAQAMPEPEAGLGAGILIGLRERVSRSIVDDFTTTGLTHVVAISGWNIALVAGIATGLLRALGLGRRIRSLLVIAAIVGYTVLAGAEASVVRAALMGGVVLIAREGGRASGAAAALGLAAWLLLLVDPHMISDIGLQLSLAATAGLLALGGPAEAALGRVTGGRAPRWFCETLGVSLAAQLATLPLILLHFGRLSLISPLANLLVAPVVPFAMLGALLAVLVGAVLTAPIVALVAAPLLLAAWLPLTAMVRGAGALADVPFADLELAAPFDTAAGGLALAALWGAIRAVRGQDGRRGTRQGPTAVSLASTPGRPARRVPGKPAAAAAAALLVAVSGCVLIARPSGLLHVSVLDIGQGDAILLEAEDGQRLLVDGGPDPDLLVRRLDERVPLWDRHIDIALLTHPHEDHAGGLAGLVPRYSVGRIIETGMQSPGSGITELRTVARRYGIGRTRLVQGDELWLGRVHLRVAWPPPESIPETAPSSGRGINDTSIVLVVSVGRQRILLTGDLEEDKDDELLDALPLDGHRWDLLKVAHHGSATASSAPLLEALQPRLSVVSAGLDNPYGHPSPSALQRLHAVGSRVWRTDTQGTFAMSFDGRAASFTGRLDRGRRALPCPVPGTASPSGQVARRDECYARPDGGPHPNRSALIAHVHLPVAAVVAARHGRRRGRRSARPSGLAGRGARGPEAGRDSRAPP